MTYLSSRRFSITSEDCRLHGHCMEKLISYKVFLVSKLPGDLTDAKSEDNMGSQQYVEEWEVYKNILQACRVTEKTVWLDIRGNHGMSHIHLQSIPNYLYLYILYENSNYFRSTTRLF